MISNADLIDVYALAHALLRDSPWYRGGYRDPTNGSMCLVTALSVAADYYWPRYSDPYEAVYLMALEQVQDAMPKNAGYGFLPVYNDAPGRRKRDVLRLIERAVARVGTLIIYQCARWGYESLQTDERCFIHRENAQERLRTLNRTAGALWEISEIPVADAESSEMPLCESVIPSG